MSAWKPGDVAVVRWSHDEARGEHLAVRQGDSWATCNEGVSRVLHLDVDNVRPLVIIDPEDRDEVGRLADLFCDARWSHIKGSDECDPLTRSSMRDAVARFAAGERSKYPKPDEPTGLGAVVEDDEGERWIFAGHGEGDDAEEYAWWSPRLGWSQYGDINAVRVLGEGVTS